MLMLVVTKREVVALLFKKDTLIIASRTMLKVEDGPQDRKNADVSQIN